MDDNIYINRWKILAVVLISPFMGTIDGSIVNIALPVMAKHLEVGINSIQWVVTSYLIVISAFILIFGKLSDKFGKVIIFNCGFLIFGLGSFLCAISQNIDFLVFSRVVQALGAAMFMSVNQAIIAASFPKGERGRALGLLGSTVAIGSMVGPPVGGIMVQVFNWQSIFFINIPIAVFAFIAGRIILPKEKIEEKALNFDLRGALLFIIFIISIFWAFLSGEELGWSNKKIIISFILGILCGIGFYFTEKHSEDPMVDLSMFNDKFFDISILCAFISFLCMFCVNIIQPFYLQSAMKISPAVSGIIMLALPVSMAVFAPISGYAADMIGPKVLTAIGLLIMSAGLCAMAFLNLKSTYFNMAVCIAAIGIGNGMFQSPNNAIVMSLAPRNKLGIVGSMNALVRNIGMVSGITFSVALLYNRMSSRIGYKVTGFIQGRPEVFLYGMKVVYLSAAFICVLGMILTVVRIIREYE
ncbi:MFS transporter [Clostridium sp. LBM24168]